MDTMKSVSNVAHNKINMMLLNPYVMAVLKITLTLYAAQIAPKFPVQIQNIFQNTFVKIIAISLIAYLAEVDFQLSIILAVIFVLSSNLLSGRKFFESYNNIDDSQLGTFYADQSKYTDLLGKQVSVGSTHLQESLSDNFPGCNNVTIADLLTLFDNDHIKMQNTLQYAINELLQKLPADSDAKTRLIKIAHVIGLPNNVELNDNNAPLIATLLLQYGFKISDICQAPN